jgi:YjbE family integral membrane protein
MDLGVLGAITFDWAFLSGLFKIVIIDLFLSGENGVCIAMAVRSLPKEQRRKGVLFGAGAAVLLRVVLTFFVAEMLQVNFIKIVGGLVLVWIAVKLCVEGAHNETVCRQASSIGQAVKIIIIADASMSLDNMLGVAAASHGNLFLLLFGLALSIPFVVLTSNLLAMIMEKYPVIIYVGAAVLGKVSGEMIVTDPFVQNLIGAADWVRYTVEGLFAVGVIVIGKIWLHVLATRAETGGNPGKETDSPVLVSRK